MFSALLEHLRAGKKAVLCAIVAAKGSSPRGPGAMMAVLSDGRNYGTIGGGQVEYSAGQQAALLMDTASVLLKTYDLSSRQAATLGMICGGEVTVLFMPLTVEAVSFFEALTEYQDEPLLLSFSTKEGHHTAICAAMVSADANRTSGKRFSYGETTGLSDTPVPGMSGGWFSTFLSPPGRVFLFGAGHVSAALAPLLHTMAFPCIVIDDRAEFANGGNFPHAGEIVVAPFENVFSGLTITPADYLVIMTRGHLSDYDVLRQALHTKARYIGMMGSKTKIKTTKEKLLADGFTEEQFHRVYTPIGLPLGGETPEEIAISIAAQLIQVRYANIDAKQK